MAIESQCNAIYGIDDILWYVLYCQIIAFIYECNAKHIKYQLNFEFVFCWNVNLPPLKFEKKTKLIIAAVARLIYYLY